MSQAAADRQFKELQKRLERLSAHPHNRLCFDCSEKGPKWASTNLGIFICLRCAGIHRALGVHISKVKSTTMDKWEPRMVEFIARMGNERAKAIYEAKPMPEKANSSWPDSKLDKHLRQKYEQRTWWCDPSLDSEGIEAIAMGMEDIEVEAKEGKSPTMPSPPKPSSPAPVSPVPVASSATASAAKKPAVPVAAAPAKPAPVAKAPAKPKAAEPEESLLLDFSEKAQVTTTAEDILSSSNANQTANNANKEVAKNSILSAFATPAGRGGMGGMGGGMGPPPLAGMNSPFMNAPPNMGMGGGMGGPNMMGGGMGGPGMMGGGMGGPGMMGGGMGGPGMMGGGMGGGMGMGGPGMMSGGMGMGGPGMMGGGMGMGGPGMMGGGMGMGGMGGMGGGMGMGGMGGMMGGPPPIGMRGGMPGGMMGGPAMGGMGMGMAPKK